VARARLDRYLVRNVGGSFLLAVSGFTLVLLINQVFLLARQTIEKRVPLSLVAGFVLAELPQVLGYTLPMGALVAVLVGIGRLASHHEIVAMRSAGISPLRVFRPVLAFAILVTLVAAASTHYLEPLGYRHQRMLTREVLTTRDLAREISPGLFYDRLPGAVLYAARASETESRGRVFEGVLLYQEPPDGKYAVLIVARRGTGVFDAATGRISLLLDDGERHLWFPDQPDDYHLLEFRQHTITFPPDLALQALGSAAPVRHKAALGLELPRYIEELERGLAAEGDGSGAVGIRTVLGKARLEWYMRWSLPASVPVLMLVAFPLAARTMRGGRFAGLTQALLIILAFWLMLRVGTAFSQRGAWPLWLGAWLPHLVIGAWAAPLWLLIAKGRETSTGPLARALDAALSLLRAGRRSAPRPRRAAARRPLLLKHLDAYLSRGHIRMTLAALLALSVLALAIDLKEAIEEVPTGSAVPWKDVVAAVGFAFPGRLRFLLPMSVLVGVLVSLSALSRGSELVAMRASGVGPIRIAAPLIAVTCGLALSYAVVQEKIVPSTEEESRQARDRISGRPAAADVDSGRRWLFGEAGHLWAYVDWDQRRERILGPMVVLVDLDNARVLERIEAREATEDSNGWTFEEGLRRTFTGGQSSYGSFARLESALQDDAELFRETRTRLLFGSSVSDQMTFAELRRHVRRTESTGYADPAPLKVGLHEKLAQPVVPVLLVIFGVPLVVGSHSRKGSLAGFGLSLLILLAFYGAWAATTSFGREGVLSAPLAVWLPPALLGAGGVLLMMRAR
jgi:LPS export ABC transporter permease LptF/LPS export ABC transporter permease LptG